MPLYTMVSKECIIYSLLIGLNYFTFSSLSCVFCRRHKELQSTKMSPKFDEESFLIFFHESSYFFRVLLALVLQLFVHVAINSFNHDKK